MGNRDKAMLFMPGEMSSDDWKASKLIRDCFDREYEIIGTSSDVEAVTLYHHGIRFDPLRGLNEIEKYLSKSA